MVWTAEVEATGKLYTGGYNTTMVFEFNNGIWSILYWHDLWLNTLNLITCGSSVYVSTQTCAISNPGIPNKNTILPGEKAQRVSSPDSAKRGKILFASRRQPTSAPVFTKLIGGHHRSLDEVNHTEKHSVEAKTSVLPSGGLINGATLPRNDVSKKTGFWRDGKLNGLPDLEVSANVSGSYDNYTSADMDASDVDEIELPDFPKLRRNSKKYRSGRIGKRGYFTSPRCIEYEDEEDEIKGSSLQEPMANSTSNGNETAEPSYKPTTRPSRHPTRFMTAMPSVGEEEDEEVQRGGSGILDTKKERSNRKEVNEKIVKVSKSISTPSPSYYPSFTPSMHPTRINDSRATNSSEGIENEDEDEDFAYPRKVGRGKRRCKRRAPLTKSKVELQHDPTMLPTSSPSVTPSSLPTFTPSVSPSVTPSVSPTQVNDTNPPTYVPSSIPTAPTFFPSSKPSALPSTMPTAQPTPAKIEASIEKRQSKATFHRINRKPVKVEDSASSVDLTVIMYDSSGKGWYKPDYTGTSFYISDDSKTELIAYGTLENGTYSGYCEYCFGEGSFYFRVSANKQRDARWSFCHTNGSYSEQLSFHIEDGVCVPDALLTLEQICDKSYSSVVTVSGVLSVSGIPSEMFDTSNNAVFAEALAYVVEGWDEENIDISSVSLNIRQTSKISRSLLPFSYDIIFEVSFVPEIAFDFEGLSYDGVQDLVDSLEDELKESVLNGDLLHVVQAIAEKRNARQLQRISKLTVVSLSLLDITYIGTTAISISNAEEFTGVDEEHNVGLQTVQVAFNPASWVLLSVFLSVALVVVGAAVMIWLQDNLKDRQPLPVDSTHLSPSEMDTSESNHFKTGAHTLGPVRI